MDQAALISALRSQRRRWVDLPGGKSLRVRIQRPAETEFGKFRSGVTVDDVVHYVDGWDGFTESTILGDAVGAEEPVEFSSDLWRELVRDRAAWVQPVAQAIVYAITEHIAARDAASGN